MTKDKNNLADFKGLMLKNVLSKNSKIPNHPVGSYLYNEHNVFLQLLNAQKCQHCQKIQKNTLSFCWKLSLQ
jgi:hypothetical protein